MELNITSTTGRHLRLVKRTSARAMTAQSRAITSSQGSVWSRRVLNYMLILSLLASLLMAGQRIGRWYTSYMKDQESFNLLQNMRRRQTQYARHHQSYAGSLTALRMAMTPEQRLGVQVISARLDGIPAFLAEFCREGVCKSIDAQGQVRVAMEIRSSPDAQRLPTLTEGEGRFFHSTPARRAHTP